MFYRVCASAFVLSSCLAAIEIDANLAAARQHFLAARHDAAIKLYQQVIAEKPSEAEAHLGLVRAYLAAHKSKDAYAAVDAALKQAPGTPASESAAGFAEVRRGELVLAETRFRSALKLDPQYPPALIGMARLSSIMSRFKTARGFLDRAYAPTPDEPAALMARANDMKGEEHIAMLERILAIYDPDSDEASGLRAHIESDREVGDRKLRILRSPYQSTTIPLVRIMNGTALRGSASKSSSTGRRRTRCYWIPGPMELVSPPKPLRNPGCSLSQ